MFKKFYFYLIFIIFFSTKIFAADPELVEKSKIIQDLLFKGNFAQAEPIVRKCLEKVPQDLYFLSQLDIVLNGEGKFKEADEIRSKILEIWNKNQKQIWISKGSPIAESAWVRMIASSKNYTVIGTEYYIPEIIGKDSNTITHFYKMIVEPKTAQGTPQILKLEMSKMVEPYYVLGESNQKGHQQIRPYGSQKPDIRQVVKDTVSYLDGNLKPLPIGSSPGK